MEKKFEEESRDIEKEAESYTVDTNFTIEELKDKVKENTEKEIDVTFILYLISENGGKLYLDLNRHGAILKKHGLQDSFGGQIIIDKKFKIIEVNAVVGEPNATPAPSWDFPLIKIIMRRYLDKIK